MFRTYPEAEIPYPLALAQNGQRAWQWVELPFCITYFLITFHVRDGDCTLARTLLFGNIHHVLQAVADPGDDQWLERVELLIPSYLHDGDGYKLSRIKDVWMNEDDHSVISFTLDDGSRVLDAHCDREDALNVDLKLVARF